MPDAVQASVLERTSHTVNECANRVSESAFAKHRLKGSVKELRSPAYVVGAASPGRPTTSPGSTRVTAHARRGYS
ncbi:hypothetical protein ACGRHY_09980 [Streptomyces sp. HK10]|uniref:hypothetical protein n=1 Tax=Streptomyces sp. HK10 TaxID=3373255 RepID=UPI003747F3C8